MEKDVNSVTGNYGRTRTAMKKKKKKRQGHGGNGDGNRMKKGFSDEQVRRLETMFETETKPEPRKKVELARELGLQPRQVAIWFQNRRARWKAKQLEREYRSLKCNYDKLSIECESLKKEKQNLRSELQRISCMLGRPRDRTTAGDDEPVGTFCGGGHDANFICGHEGFDHKRTFCLQLHEGTIENSVEVCELLKKAGDEDDGDEDDGGSLTETPKKWCGFGSSEPTSDYDSCTNNAAAQWWNFYN